MKRGRGVAVPPPSRVGRVPHGYRESGCHRRDCQSETTPKSPYVAQDAPNGRLPFPQFSQDWGKGQGVGGRSTAASEPPACGGQGGKFSAFTLVELLTVIAIIALLAAILFPVFARVREKGRQSACISNLHQIGLAVQMYAQDYDGLFPYALDASDVQITQIWNSQPAVCYAAVQQMKAAGQVIHYHQQPLGSTNWAPGVLDTYIHSRNLWHCPSDSGFDFLDNNDSCGGPCPMPSRPTMYESQGSSYLWHTSLGVTGRNIDSLSGTTPSGQHVGPEGINVFFDGNGSWHGSPFAMGRNGLRYETLFADGHAKLLSWTTYNDAWYTTLDGTSAGPCQ